MSDTDKESQPPGKGFWSQTTTKVVAPVLVAVIAALLIGFVTPLGKNVTEFLFPTKAAVSGSVFLNGKPAAGARVAVDEHTANADDRGTFVLTGIGTGTHMLLVDVTGAKQGFVTFHVERDESKVALDPIELNPLVQLSYFRHLGAVRFDYSSIPPTAEIDYEIALWLEGERSAINGVKSVTYRLPDPLSAPITVTDARRRNRFCYSRSDVLSSERLNSTSEPLKVAHADVDLGDGHSITIDAAAGEERPTFDCRHRPGPDQTTTMTISTTTTTPTTTTTRTTTTTQTTTTTPTTTPTLVTVPNVVGQPVASAEAMLQGAEFQTSVITVASSEPKGIVASQNPAAGTKVAPNTPISLSVSDGSGYTPAPRTVPDVVGMTEANAKALLESKRFIVSVGRESTTDPSLDGVVLSQTPAAGTKGSEGDKVRITVGRYRH
jgi:hypothetical protein